MKHCKKKSLPGLASPSFDIWCFWGKITRPAEIKLLNFLSLKHHKNEYLKLKSIPKTDFHNFSKNIITLFKEKILAQMELMIWDILQAGSISFLKKLHSHANASKNILWRSLAFLLKFDQVLWLWMWIAVLIASSVMWKIPNMQDVWTVMWGKSKCNRVFYFQKRATL